MQGPEKLAPPFEGEIEPASRSGSARRPVGMLALLASLAAIGAASAAWLAAFAGLAFIAGALTGGGPGVFEDLLGAVMNFDPRRLATDPVAQRVLFGGGSIVYLAALAGMLSIAWLVGRGDAGALLAWRGPWPRLGRTAWTLIALAPLYHVLAGTVLRYFVPDFAIWLIAPRDLTALAFSFVMIVILAPLVEELLFRGWIFGSLRARFSAGATILGTTFLFAVVHVDQTGLYPVAVLVPGFILGVIRERTGSTKAAVLAHAIYNLVGWVLLVLAALLLMP